MMKEPNSYMLDLLKALCEKIPSLSDSSSGEDFVQMSCPWHQFHSVSPSDFMLLEDVEAAVGSAVQQIKILKVDQPIFEGPLLSALGARVARQQEKITIVGQPWVLLDTEMAFQHLTSLMEKMDHTEQTCCITLYIDNLNNADVWTRLGKALSTAPKCVQRLLSKRDLLMEGRKEDLKKVWDSLDSVWVVSWEQEGKTKSTWFYKEPLHHEFPGWKELEEMLDKFDME